MKKSSAQITGKLLNIMFILAIILYIGSVIFINYFGSVWYNFDMYSDMYVAKEMSDSLSLFPSDWIFGNQLYVAATPVLAALLNLFIHNSFYSMATASTLMMLFMLTSFLWMCKPVFEKKCITVGLLCFSGAFLFGNSASQYTQGFQLFYTMASYYACYMIGILLHMGVYIRLMKDKHVNIAIAIFSILLAFMLGMQSLRQTLVLYIPICLMDAFFCIFILIKKKKFVIKKQTIYNIITFGVNVLGYFFVKLFPVNQYKIIASVEPVKSLSELNENFGFSLASFLNISGISFATYGIKWLPLFICSLIVLAFVAVAFVLIIIKKDFSCKSIIFIFCIISIASVMLVGIFMFRIRPVYLFVWFLLGTISCMLVFSYIKKNLLINLLMIGVLLVSVVNYSLSFIIDFKDYSGLRNDYTEILNDLDEMNVNCIYNDFHTAPTIAACSNDKIVSGTVVFDYDSESDGMLYPSNYLRSIDLFENHSKYNTCVVFSNWTMDELQKNATPEYCEKLFSGLTLVKEKQYSNIKYYFYRINDEKLIDYYYRAD